MDWKSYYRRDLERDEVRAALAAALSHQEGDLVRGAPGERGTILSFPHTAARYAGPIQARVVAGLYRSRPDLVLALDVLHLSGLALFRELADEGQSPARRSRAFSALGEGFIPPAGSARTAFGRSPLRGFPARRRESFASTAEGSSRTSSRSTSSSLSSGSTPSGTGLSRFPSFRSTLE